MHKHHYRGVLNEFFVGLLASVRNFATHRGNGAAGIIVGTSFQIPPMSIGSIIPIPQQGAIVPPLAIPVAPPVAINRKPVPVAEFRKSF